MHRTGRILCGVAAAALLLAAPSAQAVGPRSVSYEEALPAGSESGSAAPLPEGGRVARTAWDLLVLRPLGLVQTIFSLPFLVVSYPITLLTGGSEDVVEICWTQPVEQTFKRPLGEL